MLIVLGIFGYLLGSISVSYLLGKYTAKIDIREYGSGNAGTTNALRVLGPKVGVITLIFDFLKSFLPVYLLYRHFIYVDELVKALIVGVFIVLGHDFSIMLNFKGGKGVATSIGILFAFAPRLALLAVLSFIIIVAATKIVSLASIGTATWIMIFCLYIGIKHDSLPGLIITGLALLLIVRHHSNIKKLLIGEEKKISIGKGEGK